MVFCFFSPFPLLCPLARFCTPPVYLRAACGCLFVSIYIFVLPFKKKKKMVFGEPSIVNIWNEILMICFNGF